ncbi:MAG: TatD family hydrolase [Collinsella sp.]
MGLDFSARFAGSEPLQIQALDRLCDALVQHPLVGRVISIHAVRSAGAVLDVLESHGLLIPNPDSPVIIFHWFSGTSDELVRARDADCYFSVNQRMLATKRGREYADRSHSIVYCSRPMHRRGKHRNKRTVAHQIAHKDLRTHRLTQKL